MRSVSKSKSTRRSTHDQTLASMHEVLVSISHLQNYIVRMIAANFDEQSESEKVLNLVSVFKLIFFC